MKYKTLVFTMTDNKGFDREVQKHLDEGWNLQGGVSIYFDAAIKLAIAQAITKESNDGT